MEPAYDGAYVDCDWGVAVVMREIYGWDGEFICFVVCF